MPDVTSMRTTRLLPTGIAGGFLSKLIYDAATGKLRETEVARAIDLREIMVSSFLWYSCAAHYSHVICKVHAVWELPSPPHRRASDLPTSSSARRSRFDQMCCPQLQ